MKIKLTVLLLMFCLYAKAQQRDTLQGHITVADANGAGIFIINKKTGTEVKSDAKGLFKILAKNGDRLAVYSNTTIAREFLISTESFKNPPYDLEVEPQSFEIEEVVVAEIISPEALGLPKNQKHYTPAERRVKTATDLNPKLIGGFGLIGAALSLDPLINAITGRTKMLKKELATERKIMGMENLNNIYTEEQIVSELAIPPHMVQAFLYYAVEDNALAEALKSKNDERAKLELYILADKYLALLKEPQVPPTQNTPK